MANRIRVFTIREGKVTKGALVEKFSLKGVGMEIPAILVGEDGRGRKLGVLPVHLLPHQKEVWEEKGEVIVNFASIGHTRSGRPKLIACPDGSGNDEIIVVFRTHIGFRGGNSHTGDRKRVYYTVHPLFRREAASIGLSNGEYTEEEAKEYNAAIVRAAGFEPSEQLTSAFESNIEFLPFPGEIITRGVIAQGTAGRMGSGEQLVAVMPRGVVFRTGYSGRLYGAPTAHYYIWDGENLLSATWQERSLVDLF